MVFYGVYEHNLAICAIISALPEFSSITNEKILLTLVENPGTIYFILLWGKVTMMLLRTFDFNFFHRISKKYCNIRELKFESPKTYYVQNLLNELPI